MLKTFITTIGKLSLFLLMPFYAVAQITIPNNSAVVENFDGIGNSATASLPANWQMSAAGIISNWAQAGNVTTTTQAASSPSPTTGGRYNWGTGGADRAVGFMTSETYASPNTILAHYRNTSGFDISSLNITFNIERYRINTAPASIAFFSSADGLNWTPQPAGSVSPAEFQTGVSSYTFASPTTVAKSVTISSILIPTSGDFYLRWVFNTSGVNSQGLGLDDVSVTATLAPPNLSARLGAKPNDENLNGTANPGETIKYRDTVKNSGTGAAYGVEVTYPANLNADEVVGSLKTSPLARDDNYSTPYGVQLTTQNVLLNDYGIPAPTVVSYGITSSGGSTKRVGDGNSATDMGGTISITAAGIITYTPPPNFCGVDKFAYIDTAGVGLPNNNAIVYITVNSNIIFTTLLTNPCNGQANGAIKVNATGASETFTYSIDGTNFQPGSTFSNLGAGSYIVTVKDATCTAVGTATLSEAAPIVVSGDIPNLTFDTEITSVPFTQMGGAPAGSWSAPGLPAGLSIDPATGIVSGKPMVTGSFTVTITYTDGNNCTGSITDAFNVAPKLADDAYNVVGNTQLVADGHSSPSTPFTTSTTKILSNDEPRSPVDLIVTAGTFATQNGGSIIIDDVGKFIYTPPVDVTGVNADSYTYTATSNGVSATAKINFTITDMIWYVRSAAPNGGDGRSNTPFNTMTAVNTASTNNGDFIYVYQGTPTGAYAMKPNQKLIGAGATLNVPTAISPVLTINGNPANTPTLDNTITLANDVTVNGIDMSTGANRAISSSGATNVNVDIRNVSSTGATNAVSLASTTGTVSIAGGTQTNSTGATFIINGGSVSLTYSGNINHATVGQPMVHVLGGNTSTITFNTGTLNASLGTGLRFDNADGTYNFNGPAALTGGTSGIEILNGSSGTFDFGTQTSINVTGTAINISGNAETSSANVTYRGNVLMSNANTLLNVSNHAGPITFQDGTLTASNGNGSGLRFSNADGTYNFNGTTNLSNTEAFADAGIDIIDGSDGTFNFTPAAGHTAAITNPTGIAFNIGNLGVANSGGGGNVTYNGTISKTSSGRAIEIQRKTGGTVAFNGNVSATSSSSGINLATNTGATFNFPGIITLDGLSSRFAATGGGTINLPNAANTIGATNAPNVTALNISNTTIAAGGLKFQKISSIGGTNNGIIIDNTGVNGLTIAGSGTAGSGGSISGKLGADGSSPTQGTGIYLNNCNNISLDRMDIQGCQNYGIRGLTVNTFTLSNSTIGTTTKNGTSVSADQEPVTLIGGEGSVRFTNLTGTCTITGSTLDNGYARTVFIHNATAATTLNLSITNSTLNQNLNNSNGGDPGGNSTDAFFMKGISNTTMNLTVTNCQFTAYRQFGILTDASDAATMDITVTGSNFSNSNTGNVNASAAINIAGAGNLTGGSFAKYTISGNTFRHGTLASGSAPNNGGAQIVSGGVSGRMTVFGKILNNTIGVTGVPFSGAGNAADALRLFQSGSNGSNGNTRYLVQGNTIQRYGEAGIQFNSRQSGAASSSGPGGIDATVLGNIIREPGTVVGGAFAGIWVNSGALPADNNTVNIAIGGTTAAHKNTLTDSDPGNTSDIFLDRNSCGGCASTINLYRNGSIATGATNIEIVKNILIDDNNPTLDLATVSAAPGFYVFTNNSTIGIQNGLPAQPPLMFATGKKRKISFPEKNVTRISDEEVRKKYKQAILIWKEAGLDQKRLELLRTTVIKVSDLNEGELGKNVWNEIFISPDADGKGWSLAKNASKNKTVKVDLLTCILHEMGHIIGLKDLESAECENDIMYSHLKIGVRRLPNEETIKRVPKKEVQLK